MTDHAPTTIDSATSDRRSSCARCSLSSVAAPSVDGLACGCETACGASGCQAPPTVRTAEVTPRDVEHDMVRRMQPTDTAVAHARALLAAEPGADLAFIPMCLPGKEYGWWRLGQQVVTVPGVVLLARKSSSDAGAVPSGSWARNTAAAIARQVLQERGQDGVAAYAVVRREGHTPVFEDPL